MKEPSEKSDSGRDRDCHPRLVSPGEALARISSRYSDRDLQNLAHQYWGAVYRDKRRRRRQAEIGTQHLHECKSGDEPRKPCVLGILGKFLCLVRGLFS